MVGVIFLRGAFVLEPTNQPKAEIPVWFWVPRLPYNKVMAVLDITSTLYDGVV
jgi:hypothetical protein